MKEMKQIVKDIDESVTQKWEDMIELCDDLILENCENNKELDEFYEKFMEYAGGLTADAMQVCYERFQESERLDGGEKS